MESALLSYAAGNGELKVRAFLRVISRDELSFLCEFLGTCTLISSTLGVDLWSATPWAEELVQSRGSKRANIESLQHKLTVAREFAALCGSLARTR